MNIVLLYFSLLARPHTVIEQVELELMNCKKRSHKSNREKKRAAREFNVKCSKWIELRPRATCIRTCGEQAYCSFSENFSNCSRIFCREFSQFSCNFTLNADLHQELFVINIKTFFFLSTLTDDSAAVMKKFQFYFRRQSWLRIYFYPSETSKG